MEDKSPKICKICDYMEKEYFEDKSIDEMFAHHNLKKQGLVQNGDKCSCGNESYGVIGKNLVICTFCRKLYKKEKLIK